MAAKYMASQPALLSGIVELLPTHPKNGTSATSLMLHIARFTFSPIAENTYVLYNDAAEACIVDPGCYTATEQMQLRSYISRQGLQVQHILLTHAHLDHVFGLDYCVQQYQLLPTMHAGEVPVLERAEAAGMAWGLPFGAYMGPVQFVADGAVVQLGTEALEVIFAPGHSPGHVCYYHAAQGWLLGGDVLFRESIGRTDLPGGNHAQLLQSIHQRLLTLPPQTIVYPGHGGQTTIGHEARHNPFLQNADA